MSKLILLIGETCAGKTSYKNHIFQTCGDIFKPFLMATTKKPRCKKDIDNPVDYTFVSKDTYDHMAGKPSWVTGESYGNRYGFDTEEAERSLNQGRGIVLGIHPWIGFLESLQSKFGEIMTPIFIDVRREVLSERLKCRPENERNRLMNVTWPGKNRIVESSIVFKPQGNLTEDCLALESLIGVQ